MKKIGVIGTGIMGSGIVRNFLKHDYEVYVWNRNREKLKELVMLGAVEVNTPREAGQIADIVFEVTANDHSSKSVWTGRNGILAGANPDKVLIASATLSAGWVDRLGDICAKKNLVFFDMPMTGGRIGAETGKLILLAGGDELRLEAFRSDLSAIAEKIIYFGPVGSGIRYKLILNMLQGIHIAALGEALSLAEELGLDVKKVGDSLAERPGGVTTNLAWRDYQVEPDPINFSIDWIFKDLNYARQLRKRMRLPLLDQTLRRYRDAVKRKMGQKDWTLVNKLPR